MLRQLFKKDNHGQIALYLLIVVIVVIYFLTRNFSSPQSAGIPPKPIVGLCCDSGDGDKCKPSQDADKTFTFEGQKYGLLKSDITFSEAIYHLKDTGEKFNEDPIIVNTSNQISSECGKGVDDQVWGPGGCVAIPKAEIIYVCRENCASATTDTSFCGSYPGLSCYGTHESEYDVYFRLSDLPTPGVPDVIKNCSKVAATGNAPGLQQIVMNNTDSKSNSIQLKTFSIVDNKGIPWLSPYCKPAIYLYPKEKMQINVKVAPKGKLTLTIPPYPQTGWDVTADPNGDIWSGNNLYKYLYYEAQVPDKLIDPQDSGYVVPFSQLSALLTNILPKLGLNFTEQQDFITYWLKVLPQSPFYRIDVIPVTTLNAIAPLDITPKPDSLIRVTLYFIPLADKINLKTPDLPIVKRDGFTVVEWGGLFKKDETHPFTCLQ